MLPYASMDDAKENTTEYRLSFLVKDEDADGVRAALSRSGAEIAKEQTLVKVRLAYPVKKHQFGFAGAFVFRTDPAGVPEALRAVSRAEGVLRAMVTREFPGEDEKKMSVPAATDRARITRRGARERVYRSQLSNEALEKKIEEILQ